MALDDLARKFCELDIETAEKIRKAGEEGVEEGHLIADRLLCELLQSLSFEKTVKEFGKLTKWYA